MAWKAKGQPYSGTSLTNFTIRYYTPFPYPIGGCISNQGAKVMITCQPNFVAMSSWCDLQHIGFARQCAVHVFVFLKEKKEEENSSGA